MAKLLEDETERLRVEAALEDREGLFRELFWYKSVGSALAQFRSLALDLSGLVEILQPAKVTSLLPFDFPI